MNRAVWLVALLAVAGCDGESSDEDAGRRRDAGPMITRDAGDVSMDGGVDPDGGGGDTDAGPTDSGSPDAGPPTDAGLPSDRHIPRELGYMGSPRGYWEYLPPSYSASGAGSPLLLFFHGVGENGTGMLGADGLSRILSNGPPRFINEDAWPAERPFIVLSSQQVADGTCPSAAQIDEFLDWALDHYNVDPDRIYLTGLSCGAIGVANYLRVHVDDADFNIAATVMISGNMRSAWETQMCDLGRTAIWGIHGDADTVAGTPPVAGTQTPMQNLMTMCPSPPRRDARLNMLPGVNHNDAAWDATYGGSNGLDIYTWMLDNHL